MGLRPLQVYNSFSCGDHLYTSDSDVYRRQNLTSKVDSSTESVHWCLLVLIGAYCSIQYKDRLLTYFMSDLICRLSHDCCWYLLVHLRCVGLIKEVSTSLVWWCVCSHSLQHVYMTLSDWPIICPLCSAHNTPFFLWPTSARFIVPDLGQSVTRILWGGLSFHHFVFNYCAAKLSACILHSFLYKHILFGNRNTYNTSQVKSSQIYLLHKFYNVFVKYKINNMRVHYTTKNCPIADKTSHYILLKIMIIKKYKLLWGHISRTKISILSITHC